MKLSTLPVMLVSFVANMVIAAISQIWGLFRYRHQHTWVKTEHKLHGDVDTRPEGKGQASAGA